MTDAAIRPDARRVPENLRKDQRLSVVTTRAVVERLSRVAAHHGMSKSEIAHDCLVRGLEGLPGVEDAEIEAAEETQDNWRAARGL
jgi:hypothetical protein